MCFSSLCSGVSPGQEFTAVINAVSPLLSQSQPIMKLLQVVSKSKYCSQVQETHLWENPAAAAAAALYKHQFARWNWIFVGVRLKQDWPPLTAFDTEFRRLLKGHYHLFSNASVCFFPDHHSLEQREAAAQSE